MGQPLGIYQIQLRVAHTKPSGQGRSKLVDGGRGYGEKLQNLTRVVFIGLAAGSGIFFLVAKGIQVHAHSRVQGYRFQERGKLAKRIRDQRVPITRHRK